MAASDAPRPKNSRTSEEEEDARSVDRLSNLPDSILASILSAMDTKLAVQTCVLSKRYEHLWRTNTHTLNFNSGSFHRRPAFDKFVSRFLSGRDRSSAVSSLSYRRRVGNVESRALTRVVKYAVSRNVPYLVIHAASKRGEELLPDVFANKYLKTLDLRCSRVLGMLVVPVCFSLPNLTTLHLDSVDFGTNPTSTGCSLSLSACTNLKNLKIVYYVESLEVVCPPQLTSLAIRNRFPYNNSKIVIVVGLRNLTAFNYKGPLRNLPSLSSDNHLSSIENVRIDYYDPNVRIDYYDPRGLSCEVTQAVAKDNCTMLRDICHARFVTLSKEVLEPIITMVPEHSPSPFANLKSAKLTGLPKDYDQNLIDQFKNYLLSSSPDATFVVEGLLQEQ